MVKVSEKGFDYWHNGVFFNVPLDSEKLTVSKGEPCKASWQVSGSAGAFVVKCRNCGTFVQGGCVPKCLLNQPSTK